MISIRSKKGYDLNLAGRPSEELTVLPEPRQLAMLPEHLPFVKPRLLVGVGDTVRLGTPLIEDKRNAEIRFLAPGAGRISDIRYGPRRVIQEIVIDPDEATPAEAFERFSEKDIQKADRTTIAAALVRGGLWPLLRALPFRDYPDPAVEPPMLFVGLGSLEPFQPMPHVYLKDRLADFDFGLKVLRKLCSDRIYVCSASADTAVRQLLGDRIDMGYSGVYPAHDPGVLLYRTKKSTEENRAWYIDGQDVLRLAHLLKTGTYPTERIVAVAGVAARRRQHYQTRIGSPLTHIAETASSTDTAVRYIQGGIMTGFAASTDAHLGFHPAALNLLPEGNHPGELLGLFRPGYRKESFSRAFTSALNPQPLPIDCNVHGGDRACIACGYCALVCPVDILPQFTYKAILAGEVEESLGHGLLDCVECGLCSYVCPSKIELFETLKNAKAEFYREQSRS
jgi:Na+-transporting NADH:ubiquinone oxidoreductase subunit A